ncbi:MAG: GNAT family N-acetyltransferase [Planctomycetes bacterium]|nr:GNAT family N-acetyltransferase [Planctomycetota bacterium]
MNDTAVSVREARSQDRDAWLALRSALWPGAAEEHREEITRYFEAREATRVGFVCVAEAEEGDLVGFAEVSIRSFAEGCTFPPVAYLEGWYVAPVWRKQGVGRALVLAAEAWGRARGCREFASDTEAENEVSRLAHRALGFDDLGAIRCFRKVL